MLISAEQIKQLYSMLQEYPTTDYVHIRSGIAASDFADYYEQKPLFNKPKLLGTIEITDIGAL
jgi:hypothetical protein